MRLTSTYFRTVALVLLWSVCSQPSFSSELPSTKGPTRQTMDEQDTVMVVLQELKDQLGKAQTRIQSLESRLHSLELEAQQHAQRTAGLDTSLAKLTTDARNLHGRTDTIVAELNTASAQLSGSITNLDQRSGQHWLFTVGAIVLLLGLLALAYWALRRGFGKRVGAMDAELGRINVDMQAKMMKLDTDLLVSLEKLVQTKPVPHAQVAATEVDHSLALKVADEITRIEQNLTQMDGSVKGHKQLTAAVKRMHENLQAAGYQLPELLGKAFDEGMKLLPSFIPDDTLQENERIITRVFKPTVLFQGRMIQAGEVQVSQG